MWKTTILLLLSCVVFAKSSPRPQNEDYEDEYDYSYSDSESEYYYDDYYEYESSDDPQLVVKDEYAKKKCSDFESDGFSCVPFYGCLAGEIITNGATLINTRGLNGRKRKKRSFDLGPLDAKCFCGTEICCRHPEYKDVPLEIDPATLKDASDDEKCIVTTPKPKPTTPKSFIKAEPTAAPVKPTITPAKPTGITAKSTTEKAEPAVITDKPTTVKPTTTPGVPFQTEDETTEITTPQQTTSSTTTTTTSTTTPQKTTTATTTTTTTTTTTPKTTTPAVTTSTTTITMTPKTTATMKTTTTVKTTTPRTTSTTTSTTTTTTTTATTSTTTTTTTTTIPPSTKPQINDQENSIDIFTSFRTGDENQNEISCGGHFVSKCSECDIDYADWCHGDCNLCEGSCVLISEKKCSSTVPETTKTTTSTTTTTTKPPTQAPRKPPNPFPDKVSCGGHEATNCFECDQTYADWCNGDCSLCNGQCVLKTNSNCSFNASNPDGQSNSGFFEPANMAQSNKSTSNPGYQIPLPGYSSHKPPSPGSQIQFPPDRPFHPSPPFRRHPRPNRIGGYPAPYPKRSRKPISNQHQNRNDFESNPWKPFKPMYQDFVNLMKPWKQKMANWK